MADLTFTTKTVKDSAGVDTVTQLYADPNRSSAVGAASAIVLKAGTLWDGVPVGPSPSAPTLHRSAITSADKLAALGTLTPTAVTGGSLASATSHGYTVAAYNRHGNSLPRAITQITPGGSNTAVRLAFAAVTGADGYDVFLSTSQFAPAWVARITEADLAAGAVVTAVGTVTQSGGTAGAVEVRVNGTGVAATAMPFLADNAYRPDQVTGINCAGYSTIRLYVKLAVTDLRSLPACTLIPYFTNATSASDYAAGQALGVAPLTASGSPLVQTFDVDCRGNSGAAVLVDTVSGQGAAISVWYQLIP